MNGNISRRMAIKLCNVHKLFYHGGTSSMHSHLSAKHDQIVSSDSSSSSASEDPGLRLMDSFVGVKRKCSSNRAAKVTKLVCEMIARNLCPVNIVKGSSFGQLINYLGQTVKFHHTLQWRIQGGCNGFS